MRELEVSRAIDVAPLVKRYGLAIWRNLAPRVVTDAILASVREHILNLDQRSYISTQGGVLSANILSDDIRKARILPEVHDAFYHILGERRPFIDDDGLSKSGIYITSPVFHTHVWHQDANNAEERYSGCVWIACTNAGVNAPGLSFVLKNPGRYVGSEITSLVNDGPVVSPAFDPGDAVFFDVYSLHATYEPPDMKYNRVAYKLTADDRLVGT